MGGCVTQVLHYLNWRTSKHRRQMVSICMLYKTLNNQAAKITKMRSKMAENDRDNRRSLDQVHLTRFQSFAELQVTMADGSRCRNFPPFSPFSRLTFCFPENLQIYFRLTFWYFSAIFLPIFVKQSI